MITGREKCLIELTNKWAKKYFPMAHLIITDVVLCEELKDFHNKLAIAKSKAINENKLDVYFEDAPDVVIKLRELCPNTKIIQFGSRID